MWLINLKVLLFGVVFASTNACQCRPSHHKKSSLVICFDYTASMADDLIQMRMAAIELTRKLESMPNSPIDNYILVKFHDPIVDDPIVFTNSSVLISELNKMETVRRSNYDCPEQAFEAMEKGLDLANSNSILLVFTDDKTKQRERLPKIKKLIQKKIVQVYFFIGTGACGDISSTDYFNLAEKSNGLFINMRKPADLNEVVTAFSNLLDECRQIIDTFDSMSGLGTKKISIDASTKEFSLALTGKRPTIKIHDPKNVEYKIYKTLTNLDSVKIVQVLNPEPGAWTVEASANSTFFGQLSILSILIFRYGFSTSVPTTIYNTAYEPLQGVSNSISISPSNGSLVGDLNYVHLVYGGEEKEIKLTKTNSTSGEPLYTTDLFNLPNEGFKIVIHGFDSAGHQIVRLLSPEISGTTASEPYMIPTIHQINVQEGDPISLFCEVVSLEPVNIKWQKEGRDEVLKKLESSQSGLLNNTIEFATKDDIGKYVCTAKNSFGTANITTMVNVLATPLTIIAPNPIVTVEQGAYQTILRCKVTPRTLTQVQWQFNGGNLPSDAKPTKENLIISHPTRSLSGIYKCVGTKDTTEKFAEIRLNVEHPPVITLFQNLNGTNLVSPVELYDDLEIAKFKCNAEGNPKPSISWKLDNEIAPNGELILHKHNSTNLGNYSCVASNKLGSDSKSFILKTIRPPALQNYEDTIWVSSSLPLTIECPVEGKNLEYSWNFRGGNHDVIALSRKNRELKIDLVQHTDLGKYTCAASNAMGKVEAVFNVEVLYAPTKIEALMNGLPTKFSTDRRQNLLDLNAGVDLLGLTCTANGYPVPKVLWLRDGKFLADHFVLDLQKMKPSDSGLYACMAENLIGRKSLTIHIRVINNVELADNGFVNGQKIRRYEKGLFEILDSIDVPLSYFDADYEKKLTVEENKLLVIDCTVTERANTTWFKNGKEISHKKASIVITKSTPSNNGIYKCIQSHNGSQLKAIFYVTVLSPPKIRLPEIPSNIEVSINSSLHIPCMATGNYLPIIEIYQANERRLVSNSEVFLKSDNRIRKKFMSSKAKILIDSNNGYRIDPSIINSYDQFGELSWDNQKQILTLTFVKKSATLSDQEIFKCVIRDSRTTKERDHVKIPVNVLLPPYIDHRTIINYQDVYVLPNISFHLDCPIVGNPKPKLWWSPPILVLINRDPTIEIDNTDRSLIFHSSQPYQAGRYICYGENSEGIAKIIYNIKFDINSTKLIDPSNLNDHVFEEVEVEEGRSITLVCPFQNKNNMVWTVHGGKVYRSSIDLSEVYRDETVFCTSDRRSKFGKYFKIRVTQRPRLYTPVNIHNSVEGYPIVMECNVISGKPKPRVEWFGNGELIRSEGEYEITSSKLTISRSNLYDSGIYRCRATNKLGFDEISFQVYVAEAPVNDGWSEFSDWMQNSY